MRPMHLKGGMVFTVSFCLCFSCIIVIVIIAVGQCHQQQQMMMAHLSCTPSAISHVLMFTLFHPAFSLIPSPSFFFPLQPGCVGSQASGCSGFHHPSQHAFQVTQQHRLCVIYHTHQPFCRTSLQATHKAIIVSSVYPMRQYFMMQMSIILSR